MCIVSELFTFNTGETGALWETPQDRAWPWPDKFLISCEGGIGTPRTLYGKVEKNHEQRFEWILRTMFQIHIPWMYGTILGFDMGLEEMVTSL